MGRYLTNILVFDTSAAHCAAAVIRDDYVTAEAFEEMTRGQAERLVPMLEALLEDQGLKWSDLTALGVGVGPGNFTGIRIAVSTARGLSLGLGIPAIPVTSFEMMRDPNGIAAHPAEIVSVPAPRDQAYVQHFRYGRPQAPAQMIDPADPPADLELPINMTVTGHRAEDIARPFAAAVQTSSLTDIPRRLAKLAEWKWANRFDIEAPPSPLYVRPADAAPPSDPPPVILP